MRRRRGRDGLATLGIVTGGHFLSHFYILAFPPLFPMLRAEFGLSNTQLGIIVSAVSLAMLLQVPVGGLVDRVGAKRVFVGGVGITALGIAIAGLSGSYLALLGAVVLSGIGQSGFHPADYPLIEAVSEPGQRGRNFSVHTFGGFAGFATAPVIVGSIGVAYSWRIALLAVGGAGLAYAGFAAIALRSVYQDTAAESAEDPDGTDAGGLAALLRPGILIMAGFFVLVSMASKGLQSFAPLLAVDAFALTEVAGNTALTVFFTVTAVSILVGGLLADRADPRYVIAASTTAVAIVLGVVVAGVLPIGSTTLIVLFGLAGGAYGLVPASRDRLVSAHSAAGTTGRSFGLVFTASSLGSLISPTLLGAVIDLATIRLAFVLIGAFFFLSGIVTLAIGSRAESLAVRVAGRSG